MRGRNAPAYAAGPSRRRALPDTPEGTRAGTARRRKAATGTAGEEQREAFLAGDGASLKTLYAGGPRRRLASRHGQPCGARLAARSSRVTLATVPAGGTFRMSARWRLHSTPAAVPVSPARGYTRSDPHKESSGHAALDHGKRRAAGHHAGGEGRRGGRLGRPAGGRLRRTCRAIPTCRWRWRRR